LSILAIQEFEIHSAQHFEWSDVFLFKQSETEIVHLVGTTQEQQAMCLGRKQ